VASRAAAASVRLPGLGRRADDHGDRRASRPARDDELPWRELADCEAVYFTAGDTGALRAARAAKNLVATVRAKETLAAAGVQLDMLVASSKDEGERYWPGEIEPPPLLVAQTAGSTGGSLLAADGSTSHWAAAPLPAPPVDAYGAGDCFAAGLTFGLAEGLAPAEALDLGARCGAACVTGRGPYEGMYGGEA
jgi:ribokinase